MWNQRWINGGHFANLRCHSGTLQGSLGSQYHVQICTAYFDYDYKIYQYHPIPIHLYHCNSSRVTPFDSADSAGHGLRGPWPQRPILRRMGVSVWTPNDPSLHLHFWRKSGSEIIVDHFLETKTICEQFLCMIATVRVTWSASTLPGPNMPVLNLALYDSRFFFWQMGQNGQLLCCWWFSPCTKSSRKSLHSLSFSMDINSPRARGLYLLVTWGGVWEFERWFGWIRSYLRFSHTNAHINQLPSSKGI